MIDGVSHRSMFESREYNDKKSERDMLSLEPLLNHAMLDSHRPHHIPNQVFLHPTTKRTTSSGISQKAACSFFVPQLG